MDTGKIERLLKERFDKLGVDREVPDLDRVIDWDGDGVVNRREDSDNDGLSDAEEANEYGTDRQKADTDGDGLLDGKEVDDRGIDVTPLELNHVLWKRSREDRYQVRTSHHLTRTIHWGRWKPIVSLEPTGDAKMKGTGQRMRSGTKTLDDREYSHVPMRLQL